MPWKSLAQREFFRKNHPELFTEFEAETPAHAKLPERLPAKKKGVRRSRSLQGPSLPGR